MVNLFSSSSVPLRVIILSPPASGKPSSGGIGSWNDKSVLVFFSLSSCFSIFLRRVKRTIFSRFSLQTAKGSAPGFSPPLICT